MTALVSVVAILLIFLLLPTKRIGCIRSAPFIGRKREQKFSPVNGNGAAKMERRR